MRYNVSFTLDFKKESFPGKLIVLEGLDASGKSTQARELQKYYLKKGKNVLLTHQPTRSGHIGELISERYFWSSVAYGLADRQEQDYTNGKNVLLTAFSILSMYNQFILPDITLFLSLPVDVAVKRLSQMNKEKEIYEKQDQLEKIKRGYELLLNEFPQVFNVTDGTLDEKIITRELTNTINTSLHI